MQASRPPLLLTNLLNDLETLCHLLEERIGFGDTLNSYLLAAGVQQIIDDYLHRDPLSLRRAATTVERSLAGNWGTIGGYGLRTAGELIWRGALARPSDRKAAQWALEVTSLVEELAARVDRSCTWAPVEPELQARATALTGRLPALPALLRRQLLRLPACFRSFDQAPEDMATLAQRFAARWPHREAALTVIGVRSSGSYLAPLVASRLRRLGYVDVHSTTVRPGQPWLSGEARALRGRARRGGMALLVDDPPLTWASIAEVAGKLVTLGFQKDKVVLLLPVFPDSADPPAALRGHPAVLLPWRDWAISRKLEPDPVKEALGQLLQERCTLVDVRPAFCHGDPVRRGHGAAVFEVTVREGDGERDMTVRARGVGVGYLGEHSTAVGEQLPGWLPERHGFRDGVLYEGCEDPGRGLREPLTDEQVRAVVGYVAERSRTLALNEDLAGRVFFRGVPWLTGKTLSGLFGRAPALGRVLCAALTRRILSVDAPAVIDGQADLWRFVSSADGRTVKTDFDAGIFTSSDLFCFDPIFDLARAAESARDQHTADRLLREYDRATGRPVDRERWFLYRLLLITEVESGCSPREPAANRLARLLQRYYADVLLDGLTLHPSGPFCAIELDGVLETTPLGFPATSPIGAMVLRSLISHGFRPLIATGRSLAELRDRCLAYGLPGGVAEHGAVTFERQPDRVRLLIGDEEQRAFRRLRSVLAGLDAVQLEPDYSWSVRAYRLAGTQRRPLDGGLAEHAILRATAHGVLRAVHGAHQTDFAAVSVDRGTALRSLAADLQGAAPADNPVAFAVGNTGSDMEMLRLGRAAYLVGNSGTASRPAGVELLSEPAQRGLAVATTRVLGHQPGSCEVCSRPQLAPHGQQFLGLLSLQDDAGWRKADRALRLILLALRNRSGPRTEGVSFSER